MNPRSLAVLLVLLLALGGGALLYYQQQRAQKPAAAGTLGQPLLKNLKAADIASIAIRAPEASLTLEQKEGRWTIAERAGFPADYDKVHAFVLKALELKIGQVEPVGEKDRARLELDDKGTRVEFRGAEGKTLAALLVGRKVFKREPDNPDKAAADGRFVLVAGEEKIAYVVADPLLQASAKSSEWVARNGIAAEKVKSVEVALPGGEGWKIERAGDNADWKLAGLKAGEKLDLGRANSAAYSLSMLELADVAPAEAKDTGLDKAATVVAHTFDGLTYTLRVGKAEGEHHYVTLAVTGEAKPEGKDAEERAKKLAERLPRERALAGHVLLVAQSRLEDLLRKRAELLVKKEAKK